MRVTDADDVALVLEHQNVVDLGARGQLRMLRLKDAQQLDERLVRQLREGEIVPRREADDPCQAVRGAIPIDARRSVDRGWSQRTDAGMIVVEHEYAFIRRIARARHATVSGAEIT